LLWSTKLYPIRAAFGVGLSFFTVAAGQAIGASLVGGLIELLDPSVVFYLFAAVAVLGATRQPPMFSGSPTAWCGRVRGTRRGGCT
ncbi:MAG: hypothetical protein ABI181_00380, partial [Mycobacteriaceae bacterium]